jgi:hypothetical protein
MNKKGILIKALNDVLKSLMDCGIRCVKSLMVFMDCGNTALSKKFNGVYGLWNYILIFLFSKLFFMILISLFEE